MNEPGYDIVLIQRYFDKDLTREEEALFENRLRGDSDFKRLFEQERHLVGAVRLEAVLNDLEYLEAVEKGDIIPGIHDSIESDSQPNQESKQRFFRYAISAAACLAIVVVAILYLKSESPRQMASKYTKENLMYLSPTMSEGSDSLQLGIAAFNSNDYDRAERIFASLAENKGSLEAIKNLGLTYLASGQYDKALQQFDVLAGREEVYVNQGPFYKAVTLMLRSAPGDEEGAKELLREVVSKELPGYQVASGWLERW